MGVVFSNSGLEGAVIYRVAFDPHRRERTPLLLALLANSTSAAPPADPPSRATRITAESPKSRVGWGVGAGIAVGGGITDMDTAVAVPSPLGQVDGLLPSTVPVIQNGAGTLNST